MADVMTANAHQLMVAGGPNGLPGMPRPMCSPKVTTRKLQWTRIDVPQKAWRKRNRGETAARTKQHNVIRVPGPKMSAGKSKFGRGVVRKNPKNSAPRISPPNPKTKAITRGNISSINQPTTASERPERHFFSSRTTSR
jgi:hypothetical protein